MELLLLTASWISLVQRLTISALAPSRCSALTSTALATTGALSTIACARQQLSAGLILGWRRVPRMLGRCRFYAEACQPGRIQQSWRMSPGSNNIWLGGISLSPAP